MVENKKESGIFDCNFLATFEVVDSCAKFQAALRVIETFVFYSVVFLHISKYVFSSLPCRQQQQKLVSDE